MSKGSRGRVGIVGAGVAGLVAAKVLDADGFDVSVFENEAGPGDVWCESRTYPAARTEHGKEASR